MSIKWQQAGSDGNVSYNNAASGKPFQVLLEKGVPGGLTTSPGHSEVKFPKGNPVKELERL